MSRDALIVGISAYQYLPGLNAPAHDAEAIAQSLQTYGDFRVSRLPDIVQGGESRIGQRTPVTLAELETALVRLFKPKGHNIPQTALFYYSGHGLQKDAGIQEGYLATSDANPRAGFYGLSLFWLRRLLQESPVKQRIILLDCCNSGELLNFLEADPGARPGTDRLFMSASREYEAAYESLTGQHSVFTQALLDGLNPTQMPSGTVTNHALCDWVSTALKSEMQQPLFENSGGEIVLTQCQGLTTLLQPQLASEVCPYRGLEFFDEVHANYFFGREELTDQLIEKLRSHNFLAVLGASGSGKTSLVRAGLVHKLRQGKAFSGSDRWRVRLITPTDQPLKSLAAAFINPEATAVDRAEQLRRAETLLRDGGNGFADLTRASLHSSEQTRMVLVIDQFEEVFTLCQGQQAERDRYHFFNALVTALKEAKDVLSIVIVLRADFFGKCSLYHDLAEQVERNLITITPLTYEQIKASIVKPAQQVGLVVEPNLLYNILLDVVGAPGELPLLQYTLLELWHRRQSALDGGAPRLTLNAYTELGGVRGTLQTQADQVFYSLNPKEQLVARRIFIALTQLGEGTEDTRRRILKSELVSSRFTAELVEQVLEKLIAAKLIVTNRISLASPSHSQIDQGFSNMSTALRLTQMSRGKSPHKQQSESTLFFRTQTVIDSDRDGTIANLTRKSTEHLSQLALPLATRSRHQETVDVAHEALIRNWSLLRTWLDENRELLWQQRQIERTAWEWSSAGQPRTTEYLLRGDRLANFTNFLQLYPHDLSEVAQRFITISVEEARQAQRDLRLVQLAIPSTLVVALLVTFCQYQAVIKSQAEKDYQTQLATSRQRAATAQAILQEPNNDPTAALLISRLAVERGSYSFEAQASLRAVLQKLRLQGQLIGNQTAVQQLAFDPTEARIATAGADGSLHLWSLKTHALERVIAVAPTSDKPLPYTQLTFSSTGQYLAAIAPNATSAEVWTATTGEQYLRLDGFQKPITQLAVSAEGDWIAAAGSDRTLQLWQLKSKNRHLRQTFATDISAIAFSPTSQTLAISTGKTVQLLDVTTGKLLKPIDQLTVISQIAYSPNGQWLVIRAESGTVHFYQTTTGKVTHTLQRLGSAANQPIKVKRMQLSPTGQQLLTVDDRDRLQLWDVASGKPRADLGTGEYSHLAAVAFSPDGQRLVTLSRTPAKTSIHVWAVESGKLVEQLGQTDQIATSVQFSPDSSLVAVGDAAGKISLWVAEPGGELPTLQLKAAAATWAIAGDRGLLTINDKGLLQQRELPAIQHPSASPLISKSAAIGSQSRRESVVRLLAQLGNQLNAWQSYLLFNPFRSSPSAPEQAPNHLNQIKEIRLAALTPTAAKSSPLCQAPQIQPAKNQFPLAAPPDAVAFTPDGKLAATAHANTISLWQINDDQAIQLISCLETSVGEDGKFDQLAISPDAQLVLGVKGDRGFIWNLSTGQLMGTLEGHTGSIKQAQFSPDSTQIVTASADNTVRLWQVATANQLIALPYPQAMTHASFSPDGRLIAVGSADGTAQVIDLKGKLKVLLTGHEGGVLDINFSPDGTQLVTAGGDGTVRLWSAKTGIEWTKLSVGESTATDKTFQRAFFSRDGRYILAATKSGKVQVWAATWGELLGLARDRSFRQLNPDECLRYLGLLPDVCPTLDLSPNEQSQI